MDRYNSLQIGNHSYMICFNLPSVIIITIQLTLKINGKQNVINGIKNNNNIDLINYKFIKLIKSFKKLL